MWDGRESSTQTGTQKISFPTNPADLLNDLAHQSLDATNGHAQASVPLTTEQQQAIVNFEMGLATAQAIDYKAGALNRSGATGGPFTLGTQTMPNFFVGMASLLRLSHATITPIGISTSSGCTFFFSYFIP